MTEPKQLTPEQVIKLLGKAKFNRHNILGKEKEWILGKLDIDEMHSLSVDLEKVLDYENGSESKPIITYNGIVNYGKAVLGSANYVANGPESIGDQGDLAQLADIYDKSRVEAISSMEEARARDLSEGLDLVKRVLSE